MSVSKNYKRAKTRVQNQQTEFHIREVESLCSKKSTLKYGWWNTDPLILNLDIRRLWDVSFTPRSLYPLNTESVWDPDAIEKRNISWRCCLPVNIS